MCSLPAVPAATLRTERLWLFGKEYYRLDEWAGANSFRLRWTGPKDLQLESGSTRISFTGDSRRMVLNGVTVWLSHDVVTKNGTAYITPFDVRAAISPLLWPSRNSTKTKAGRHICIDAGHGGRDIGEHDGRELEKTYTLLLAIELGAQFRKAGYTVSFTRTSDTYIDLGERTEIANRRGADMFLSLHFNSYRDRNVSGVETYCVTPQGASSFNDANGRGNSGAVHGNRNDSRNMLLAYQIQKSLLRSTKAEDRGVKRARYQVLREAHMPAVLIESGFMSNPAEARKIYNAAWRRQAAAAIVSGVTSYRASVER